MTDNARRQAALKLRALLDAGVHRKQAIYEVLKDVRERYGCGSRSQLYTWCARFGVSTR